MEITPHITVFWIEYLSAVGWGGGGGDMNFYEC